MTDEIIRVRCYVNGYVDVDVTREVAESQDISQTGIHDDDETNIGAVLFARESIRSAIARAFSHRDFSEMLVVDDMEIQ